MYFGLGDLSFYTYFVFFVIAATLSWFVPGWVIVSRIKFQDKLMELALAVPVGIAFWGIQGYILGYLGWRFLTYAYLVLFLIFFLRQLAKFRKNAAQAGHQLKQQPWLLNLAIVISSFLQILGHVISGLRESEGVVFYFLRSHIMHLAYIQSLAKHFPPLEPGASGLPIENYHYWADLVLADLVRIWPMPVMHLLFQYAPVLLSLVFTLLVVRLVYRLKGTGLTAGIAVFLFTFGADAAYLFTLILHQHWGAKITMIDSGLVQYFNIPQVFARLVFVALLFPLLHWWKSRSLKSGLLTVILLATLFGFKIYYGIYAVFGFCLVLLVKGIQAVLKQVGDRNYGMALLETLKQMKTDIFLLILLALGSLAVYLPPNKNAGGLFYSPLEWPKLFLGAEQIDFNEWWLRMQVYQEAGNFRNILIFNALAVIIALIALFGTRLLGLLPTRKTAQSWPKELLLFFIPTNLLFLLLGLLTMQHSGGLNTFNFFIVPVVAFNLLAAFNLTHLPRKIVAAGLVIFVLLTLPRSLMKLAEIVDSYQSKNTSVFVSQDELEALQFIKESLAENVVVQAHPKNNQDRQTPYVAFFSHRFSYVSGLSMLESHNQPFEPRQEAVLAAFSQRNPLPELQSLEIDYIYLVGKERARHEFPAEAIVFQNSTVMVVAANF